jgi:hypothetical protein
MRPLASEEKLSTIMVYTHNLFARGQIITNENVRVSIWLRTQGAPNYIHLFSPNMLLFGGTPPKSLNYSEFYIPTTDVIAFHLAPPAHEPLDYDESEANRMMKPVEILAGSFSFSAKVRISTQADLATFLDVSQSAWMSVYDASVSNPYLPNFNMQVPMMLVNPSHVGFGKA